MHGYVNCKEKQTQMRVLPGKLLLQAPVSTVSGVADRVEGLILLLIL